MNGCYCAALGIYICILCFTLQSLAQPELPKMLCKLDSDRVSLAWTCQYEGVKSILVLRSGNKDLNYFNIGKVKGLQKGAQYFTDNAPLNGDNYYKLDVTFKTGLKWQTDYCLTKITKTNSALIQPLDTTHYHRLVIDPNPQIDNNNLPHQRQKPVLNREEESAPAKNLSKTIPDTSYTSPTNIVAKDAPVLVKKDAVQSIVKKDTIPTIPRKHFSLPVAHDTEADPICAITSRFVYTDSGTGNIKIMVNDDLKQHHYSLKFFDTDHTMVVEVPRINVANIIMDKRSFRKRAAYKFVLRKDGLELDSGFIIVR